mgnify:CR=1 FL=1
MYTEDYEQEIDLKDLLFVLLYRWRILLLAAVDRRSPFRRI